MILNRDCTRPRVAQETGTWPTCYAKPPPPSKRCGRMLPDGTSFAGRVRMARFKSQGYRPTPRPTVGEALHVGRRIFVWMVSAERPNKVGIAAVALKRPGCPPFKLFYIFIGRNFVEQNDRQ